MADETVETQVQKRYEVGSIDRDEIIGETDLMAEAMVWCRRDQGHAYILDRHATPGDVRRFEFRDGFMTQGNFRPVIAS